METTACVMILSREFSGASEDRARTLTGECYMKKLTFRILVVDDYEPWRRWVCSTLQKQPEFQIVGEVSDGPDAVRKAQELLPELILLDIGLPTLNGIDAARRIRQHSSHSKILFFSNNRSLDVVEEALRTGAEGYVVKSDAEREIIPAMEEVLRGGKFVGSGVKRMVKNPMRNLLQFAAPT